ncbi:DDRGK domain-containing protein 1-like [Lineus longissimus]|uniref:DDRGK domain-containing protein 1-like n=1 Tax=Lineus longissimus TaxID=88925 RepID=UPI002B4F5EC0
MIDPIVYAIVAVVVAVLLAGVAYIGRSVISAEVAKETKHGRKSGGGGARAAAEPRPVAAAGARRPAPRRRMNRPTRAEDDSDEDLSEEERPGVELELPDEKIGAKKLKKLQDKAEKKAMREAELEDREERKKRQEQLEKLRKEEEDRQKKEDELKAEEEKKRKEEQEAREHEEYLKLKEAFTVDEEGQDIEGEEEDPETLLQNFIDYIKESKVVMLEDLASHFKLKTQDCIDRVKSLQDEGRLTGVIDDRGKFIYITMDELMAVSKFIKQRGRVSISELAESSNKLITLNSDTDIQKKLIGKVRSS